LWVLSKNDKKGEKEAEKGQEKEEEAKKTLFDFFFLSGFSANVWNLGGKVKFCCILEATYFLVGGMF
jgi:hypothetical protein